MAHKQKLLRDKNKYLTVLSGQLTLGREVYWTLTGKEKGKMEKHLTNLIYQIGGLKRDIEDLKKEVIADIMIKGEIYDQFEN